MSKLLRPCQQRNQGDEFLQLKLLTYELSIVRVGHAYTPYLDGLQGHTNGHIKVEINEGGSKHTALPDTTGDS